MCSGVLILTQARVETDAIEHTWALDEERKDDGGVEVLFTPTPATLNHVQEFTDAVTRAHHAPTIRSCSPNWWAPIIVSSRASSSPH